MFKKSLIIFGLMLGLMVSLEAVTVRIATYNILNPIFEEKYSGKNSWPQRLPFVVENIIDSQSDLLSLEEVGYQNYLDIVRNPAITSRYLSFYVSHAMSNPGGQEGRDGIALFYRPDRVTLLKMVQSQDGSRPTHRRDFYADFATKESTPVRIRLAGTHLNGDKDLAIGNRQLAALVGDIQKDTQEIDILVVCGDFNESHDEKQRPRAEILQKAGFVTDGSTASTRADGLNVRHKGHIDWIYFKKLSALTMQLSTGKLVGDARASDHKLTWTDLQLTH